MSYRILIVDDEIGILQLLQDYFEIQGYEVLTAQNGEEAIEKAMEDLDLILLDINLPDIDGLHVCQEIREKNRVSYFIFNRKNRRTGQN